MNTVLKKNFQSRLKRTRDGGLKVNPIHRGMHFSKDLVGKSGDKKPDDVEKSVECVREYPFNCKS